jgi:hypothetical protein
MVRLPAVVSVIRGRAAAPPMTGAAVHDPKETLQAANYCNARGPLDLRLTSKSPASSLVQLRMPFGPAMLVTQDPDRKPILGDTVPKAV